ncbi:MAG: GGDEF domain-containing protein [Rhodospirillaceae bacterium]
MGGNFLGRIVFGETRFDENEEYRKFCFQFLLANIWIGVVITGLLIMMEWLGLNSIGPPDLQVMELFTASGMLFILLLRGHKERFYPIALIYAVCCYIEDMSALLFVPQDEFRVIWFYIYFAGTYIILGQTAGVIVTVVCIPSIIIANAHLAHPYSPNAMATMVTSLLLTSVICSVYTSRSVSFFRRMNDANDQLRIQAARDPLTGVMNARAYYAATERLITLSLRTGEPFSVLFVDLDHFKSINDRYGHEAGDTVLKEVAASLTGNARDCDVLGRIGGEEFSLFLPNTDLAGAEVLAEKLRTAIESLTPAAGDIRLKVTASIGVARNQPEHRSIADIQRLADQAMYLAKKQGRNRVTCFDRMATNG